MYVETPETACCVRATKVKKFYWNIIKFSAYIGGKYWYVSLNKSNTLKLLEYRVRHTNPDKFKREFSVTSSKHNLKLRTNAEYN